MSKPSRFMSLKANEKDPANNVMVKETIIQGEDYAVYLDDQDGVWWDFEREMTVKGFMATQARVGILTAIPISTLDPTHRKAFREMIGEALGILLDPDTKDNTGAEAVLDKAEEYFKARARERSRAWTLHTAFCWLVFAIVLAFIVWCPLACARECLGDDAYASTLCGCAGVVGAFLSIARRLGSLDLDFNAGELLHRMEASARLVSGAFAAVLVYLAIRSKFNLGIEWLQAGNDYIIALASLLAGTSERLIPSMVKTLDGKDDGAAPRPKA